MGFRYHLPSDRITAGSWSLTTGTARTLYPLTALDDADPSAPFWANETTVRLVRDFGTATRVDSVYLINHNFTNAATVKVQMHTANSWASPDLSVTLTIPAAHADGFGVNLNVDLASITTHFSASDRTKRYLSIVNTVANAATVYIGEVLLFSSQRDVDRSLRFSPGVSLLRQRLTSGTSSKRGVSTVYDYGSVERRISGVLPVSSTEFDELRTLEDDARGAARPFVVVVSPADATARWAEPMYVRLASTVTDPPQEHVDLIDVPVQLQELGFGEVLGA